MYLICLRISVKFVHIHISDITHAYNFMANWSSIHHCNLVANIKFACISVYMKKIFLCVIIALSLNRPCKGNRRVGRVSLKCFRVSRLCDFFKRRHAPSRRFPQKKFAHYCFRIIAHRVWIFPLLYFRAPDFLCVIFAPLINLAL